MSHDPRPTQKQLAALRAISQVETGESCVVNRGDAEECEDQGWAEAQPGGGYKLTEQGRRVLAESRSN
jgi:hypothetical protein